MKKLILGAGACVLTLVCVGTTHVLNTKQPIESKAAVSPVVYFAPNSDWASDNSWFAAKFEDNTWIKMDETGNDGIYSFPTGSHTSATFHRMNPAYDELTDAYPNSWNHTNESVSFNNEGMNLCTMTGSKYDDWNYYPTSWSSVPVVAGGTNYLVNLDAVSSFWFNDSAKTYIYTNNSVDHETLEMSRVGDSNLFSATVPAGGLLVSKIVIVRGSDSFTGDDSTNWNTHRWNQTSDFDLNSGDETKTAIYVLNDGGDNSKSRSFNLLSDNYLIDAFGNYFISATEGYCKSKDLSYAELEDIKNTFDGICNYSVIDAKTAFANGTITHSISGHGNKADEAISRYWDMTHNSNNHSGNIYSDFLQLGSDFMAKTAMNSSPSIYNTVESPALFISIASLSSMVVVGGLFFVKKRKTKRD